MKRYLLRYIVLAFLLGVCVWMVVDEDREFSEQENRNLSQFPEVSSETVFSGEFMSDFETYLADQFPARDWCIRVKTEVLRLSGQKLIGDYYLSDDNYLIQKDFECNWERVDEMLGLINGLAAEYENINVSFMLAPTAMSIYEDKLPYTAETTQLTTIDKIASKLDENVNYVDVYKAIYSARAVEMYYKTDHHWTSRAAFVAFGEYVNSLGIEYAKDDYAFYVVTNDFQGTCASGSGIYETTDTIEICVPMDSVGSYVVNYVDEMYKTASLFESDKLEIKDKYQVFMGGNHSQVDVTTNAGTGRNLLLIKDSYGNCMVPILTKHFDKIIVIDPRYFSGDIYEVMMTYRINEILFMYNVNSFVTDNSLDVMLTKE